ncbi:hypothetical protein SAMN05443634_10274 [Chishuiella changwenlii]|uniref:Lipoprotein n=1 Tax=Chishuiella changwenlii TaxID=1434701 RepID=A0A1M6TSH6_9FLAO|nr:hypothetical protein [Chishuiella changwenlii]GGF04197.1 hypothetical protein GCM10010984_21910 [Chishuiella changwenlii]SHK59901.1 hypothetical protein SAMN05443634_10274 [Chishuiella changwenlii]
MKKLVRKQSMFFYAFLFLTIFSCKDKNVNEKKEVSSITPTEKPTEVTEKVKPLSIVGTYSFGTNLEKGAIGKVYVYPITDSTAVFYLDVSEGAPDYMLTTLYGEMLVKDNVGTYDSKKDKQGAEQYGDALSNCVMKFEFKQGELTIKPKEKGCGFGKDASVYSTYKLINETTPKYFENVQGTKSYPVELILEKYKK